jgi:hypothetical protein
MNVSFDNDGHHPQEHLSKEYDRISVSEDRIFGVTFAPSGVDTIAERRPDGKWYTKRDWDAKGYSHFTVSAGAHRRT